MLVPPNYAMSGPMAKSIAPMVTGQPSAIATAAAASPSSENGSPEDQVKMQEPQLQRPSSGGSTPIAARPSSASVANGSVPMAGASSSAQQVQSQSQGQLHAQSN